jgi:hypothetical protein
MQRDVKVGRLHFVENNLCCLGLFRLELLTSTFLNVPGLSVPSPSVKGSQTAGMRERLTGDRLDRLD